jgi:hypothetical protein
VDVAERDLDDLRKSAASCLRPDARSTFARIRNTSLERFTGSWSIDAAGGGMPREAPAAAGGGRGSAAP